MTPKVKDTLYNRKGEEIIAPPGYVRFCVSQRVLQRARAERQQQRFERERREAMALLNQGVILCR
ncbi:MAG: hypothetical protein H6974_09595 [Gammaproteobacteria bacterium]|nr:hypothetical protein [Gammaproteobacteria bacterium]